MEHESKKRFPADPTEYKLYEEIGEGVSATVYRALCVPLNEIVAIKVLDLEKCNNDLDGIRREVQTMSLIDHPNVLRALCSFPSGHNLWVVMPYMAGGSALHIMKSAYPEGFEEPTIATLLHEVLKALVYLHSHGHIHRDVKAGNILIDSNGAVKLADFGVSACMFDTGDRQRSRNTFVGTPCWMAPEVMQQLHGYDFKADIWSFGITALELAHGHAPFSKYPPMKVLLMTLQNAPPGLDYERDKRFSKSFKEMVSACLVKDPKKRPTSEKLLKHSFFKHARSSEYLARNILDGLPALGDRFRILKGKEANLLLQNQSGSDELSQQEYIRGISGWNFNLDDLKRQAALIESSDSLFSSEDTEKKSNVKDLNESVNFSLSNDASERGYSGRIATSGTSGEDESQDFQDFAGPFSSAFPVRPLQALKAYFDVSEDDFNDSDPNSKCLQSLEPISVLQNSSGPKDLKAGNQNGNNIERSMSVLTDKKNLGLQKFPSGSLVPEYVFSSNRNSTMDRDDLQVRFQNGRSYSGQLLHKMKDSSDTASVHEVSLEGIPVQRKGRFQITSADAGVQKVTPLASTANSKHGTSRNPVLSTAPLIPTLQYLLHQNAMQKDQLIKLIKYVEQTSAISTGHHTAFPYVGKGDSQLLSTSSSEKEVETYLTQLQQSVGKLAEEVQRFKLKNSRLEEEINTLLSKERRAKYRDRR